MRLEKDGLLEKQIGVCFCKTAGYDIPAASIKAPLTR